MAETVVILVTWNSAAVLRPCLAALENEPADLLVVDNASTDGTAALVRETAPRARLFVNEKNLGFAAAVNVALRATQHPFVLLLNPDAVPAPGSLARLQATLANDAKAGAVGGQLVDAAGAPQRGFQVRRFPTALTMILEALLIHRLWPGNPSNRRYRCLDLDADRAAEVDQPAGAFLMIRRAAVEQVGGLDERFYPLWFEDVDLCRRLRAAGWRILYCPEGRAVHVGGHSLQRLSEADRQQSWYRNLLRYSSKHHGFFATLLVRFGVAVGMLLRIAALVFATLPRGTARGAAARAYWEVFKSCWTDA